ncbi:unnamed protein product [Tenebrio molitor]|nr:unnamed protein product [Tenebrio molitor]
MHSTRSCVSLSGEENDGRTIIIKVIIFYLIRGFAFYFLLEIRFKPPRW